MADAKVSLEIATIQSHVKTAVGDVLAEAEHVRLVVEAVESSVTEVFGDSTIDHLRRTAAILRTHTLGVLLSAARIASRAERLETLADIREMAGAQDNDISP